ncbi:MAG: MFS transporter [Alcanivoracaceae bacterium]|nr:MFS transporter [Alcanivoracaceae bacterium]
MSVSSNGKSNNNTLALNSRLVLILGLLYFAQGLPFGLLVKSLPAILSKAGLPTEYIGLLALAAIPWALKFLWSPWVDRWGRGRPNHRKRWIVGSQCCAAGLLLVIGSFSPQWLFVDGIGYLLLLLFLLNFLFATHDIASDGLAVRLLPASLRGIGNSLQSGGYKAGMIAGGAAMLIAVQVIGWRATLWLLAAGLLLFLLPVWRFAEPIENVPPRETASFKWWARQLVRFWLRKGMGLWFLLLIGYRIGDSFGSRMIKPMLVKYDWTFSQIGMLDLVSSLVGLVGAALAGLLLMRMPRIIALVLFGALQAAGLLAWGLVDVGVAKQVLFAAIFEQFADGLSTVALFTMMMDRCRAGHEGVDYTMQACLVLMSSGLFTLVSGYSAAQWGFSAHFLLSAALALAAIMPAIFWKRAIHD